MPNEFFNLSKKETREIVEEAIKEANKKQRELIDKYMTKAKETIKSLNKFIC